MQGFLHGKRIIITGAARGIGLAVARAAFRAGAHVAMLDLDEEPLAHAARPLGAFNMKVDVSDPVSVSRAVAQAAAALGGVDGLVNNAAMLDESHSASVSEDRFHQVLNTNLTSILRVSQAALQHLLVSQGAIVNTLSTQALFGVGNSVAYATAKGGGLSLTRAMAVDLAPVRVNAVAPGFVDTRMALMADGRHEHETALFQEFYVGQRKIPLARAGTPDDCAGAFLFLLSPLAAYVTGQCIAVDGGLTATY